MSNRKHGRIISKFEPFALRPRHRHNEVFLLNRSRKITRCRNTYNEFTLELLDSQFPLLFPARTTHASTLACQGRTSYNSSNHKLEHLMIISLDHHKTLFTKATTSTTPHNIRMKSYDHFSCHKNNSHNKDP